MADLAAVTIDPTATIRDVLRVIRSDRGDQALMVDDTGRLAGVVRDQDVLEALLDGCNLDCPAGNLARPPAAVVAATADRATVLELMIARGLRAVPAVDTDGRLIGLHLRDELVGGLERPNWAVIMAGGRGRRLAPLTDNIPKPMLPVAGRPILERLAMLLAAHGIRRIFLAVNCHREQIEAHFGDGSAFGCHITYLREHPDRPLGSGGALGLLADLGYWPSDPLLVLNGDLITDADVGALLDAHAASGAAATMVVAPYHHQVPFGVVRTQAGRLLALEEKPTATWDVNAGIYVLEPELLKRIPREEEFPITVLFEECLARDEHVAVWQLDGDWQDIGEPAELARARGLL